MVVCCMQSFLFHLLHFSLSMAICSLELFLLCQFKQWLSRLDNITISHFNSFCPWCFFLLLLFLVWISYKCCIPGHKTCKTGICWWPFSNCQRTGPLDTIPVPINVFYDFIYTCYWSVHCHLNCFVQFLLWWKEPTFLCTYIC